MNFVGGLIQAPWVSLFLQHMHKEYIFQWLKGSRCFLAAQLISPNFPIPRSTIYFDMLDLKDYKIY